MKYFGTDGIRGKAYDELSLTLAYRLGLALNHLNKDIVIGMDTRKSSIDIVKAVYSGIKNKKMVKFAGVIPTPGLMHYSMINKKMGIMITASHNKYQDNGIKLFDCGEKLSDTSLIMIEELIDSFSEEKYKEADVEIKIDNSITEVYVNFLKKYHYNDEINVAFDGANGAFSYILKQLYPESKLINCSPNGININDKCGSTDPAKLIDYVKNNRFELGIAFDGDGDRVIIVDKFNRVYYGDMLVYIIARYLEKHKLLTGKTIVLNELTNPGILEKLDELGINYILTPVGDVNIRRALNNGYVLGGESSGHIINMHNAPYGDGFVNSMDILSILSSENKKIYEYLYELNLYYTRERNISVNNFQVLDNKAFNRKIQKINRRLEGHAIIRKSGTEKVIRIKLFQKHSFGISKNLNKIIRVIERCSKKIKG